MLQVRTCVAPSAIHGLGLFTRDAIAKGDSVWRFVEGFDLVLRPELAHVMCRPEFLQLHAHWCPTTGVCLILLDDARYLNHAEAPNLTSWAPGNSLCIEHRAARDIAAGEELTVDYRIGDAEPFRGFNKEEAHDSARGTGITKGAAGLADDGQCPDGRHHAVG